MNNLKDIENLVDFYDKLSTYEINQNIFQQQSENVPSKEDQAFFKLMLRGLVERKKQSFKDKISIIEQELNEHNFFSKPEIKEKNIFEEYIESIEVTTTKPPTKTVLKNRDASLKTEAFNTKILEIESTLKKENFFRRKPEIKLPSITFRHLKPILKIAASVLIVFFSGWLFMFSSSPNQIASSALEQEKTEESKSGIQPNSNSPYELLVINNYKKAYDLFKTKRHQNSNTAKFYLAYCALRLSKNFEDVLIQEAIDLLSFLETLESSEIQEIELSRINYTLALAYLKQNRIEKAKLILTEIVKNENSYSEKAGIVLNKLK